jgi:Family of unknown function (DUF5946)
VNPFLQQVETQRFLQANTVRPEAWAPFAEGRNRIFENATLKAIAAKHQKSVAQVILRRLSQRGIVVLSKSVRKERPENVKWLGTRRLEDGPTHEYMESTPGCWAAFGRVLAREYGDQRYSGVHRLTVDAYAVQHPGQPGRQSIQSVGVHLVRLCLFMERGLSPDAANDAMLAAAKYKAQYHRLEVPAFLGSITVADVEAAPGPDQHVSVV